MKDFDKDNMTETEEIANTLDNKNLDCEVGESDKNNQNFEEGYKDNKEEPCGQGENNEKEEAAAPSKEEDIKKEGESGEDRVLDEEGVSREFSSCYKPPYYTPDFVSPDEAQNADNNGPKGGKFKKASKVALLIAVAILCIAASFVLGLFSRSWIDLLNSKGNSNIDLNGEDIVVVKKTPTLTVNESSGVDYVPQSLPEVVQKVGNSVVEIRTSSVVTDRFYGQYVTSGAGSGVIITQNDTAGYIITNHHVIEDAEEIVVRLTNKEEYEATLIGSSKGLDLAVIRVAKKSDETFTVADIGDSSTLIVGQEVIAIGNPLGSLGGTVTDGIISALDRTVSIDGISMTLLQHNAAINPGNSGGALFDMMGNLIGIVNAKTSESGIEGLGFAIPINIAFEYFKGVMQASSIGATVDYGYNSERIYGVYVVNANEGSLFQRLDRITKINDTEIKNLNDYYSCIDDFSTGDTIKVTVVRNKVETELEITFKQNWFDNKE